MLVCLEFAFAIARKVQQIMLLKKHSVVLSRLDYFCPCELDTIGFVFPALPQLAQRRLRSSHLLECSASQRGQGP